MPSLSMCIFSDRPPSRLAAIAAAFRGVADEIVVVVDERAPDLDLGALREVADVAVTAPFSWPLESNLEWLHAQCSGDWILRMDGDEAPSHSLVQLLSSDDWQRDATHGYIPRRWLVGDHLSWIDANPWWPDLQLRLIKNEPGLIRFGRDAHDATEVDGPPRVFDAPIYHLDLLESNLDERREKGRRYFRSNPSLRTHGGLAMGSYYTPELLTPPPSTAPVPVEDRPYIEATAEGDRRLVPPDAGPVSAIPSVSGSARSASVEVLAGESRAYAGRALELLVSVVNTGSSALDPLAAAPCRVGCQWLKIEGMPIPLESRADLRRPIPSLEREIVPLIAEVPSKPGDYLLSVGVLIEGEEWLNRVPEIVVSVIDQPHVVMAGGYSPYRHLGDDLIAGALIEDMVDEFPQLDITLLADAPGTATERFGMPAERVAAVLERDSEDRSSGDLADLMSRADGFIIAAAGSLTSLYAEATLRPMLIEAEIARAAGVPIVITSAGIGPFTNEADWNDARRLIDIAREVHVRDRLAMDALRDLDVDAPTAIVVPDAASGYHGAEPSVFAAFVEAAKLDPAAPYIVASGRPGDGVDLLEQIAKSVKTAAHALDAGVVLLPHCASAEVDDRSALSWIADHLGDDVDIVSLDDVPPDPVAVDLVRNAAVSIGSRFHNAVLSASEGKPAILFCETSYDTSRGEGLAELSGTAIDVMTSSTKFVPRRTRSVVERSATRVRYRVPHPLITVVHALGITRHPDPERAASSPTDR